MAGFLHVDRVRTIRIAALLALPGLLWAAAGLRCEADRPPPADRSASAHRASAPPGGDDDDHAPPRPLLGFALNCHHIDDLPLYLDSVDAIADLGANALIVVTPMYQERVDSTTIRRLRSSCPTREQLVAILRRGSGRGLYTILMPIVLIEEPREKEWRGVIDPDDWPAWWTSYDRFIGHFLAIAGEADVDMFVVGSELNSTEHQLERWERVIARARRVFDGPLTYSANWDRYEQVTLWPLVDAIGVSSYFELARDIPGAPVEAIIEAWRPKREKLLATAEQWERPLLLSEVGYPSLPWANAHPWNYVAEDGQQADHAAQARCWKAFFDAWADTIADPDGPVLGFCGYRWDPYRSGGEDDTGYGVLGKPAGAIIRDGLAEIRRQTGE
ncbi:MAG: hypothetical protein SYC29_15270 [Planctomycetota bacterium]|nr:hypothetical protein [Planctomycetota bacterium]